MRQRTRHGGGVACREEGLHARGSGSVSGCMHASIAGVVANGSWFMGCWLCTAHKQLPTLGSWMKFWPLRALGGISPVHANFRHSITVCQGCGECFVFGVGVDMRAGPCGGFKRAAARPVQRGYGGSTPVVCTSDGVAQTHAHRGSCPCNPLPPKQNNSSCAAPTVLPAPLAPTRSVSGL